MYKVWVLGVGENTWATNGLDFESIDEAKAYGNDLLSRWFGADKFEMLPMDDMFQGHLTQDVIDNNSVQLPCWLY